MRKRLLNSITLELAQAIGQKTMPLGTEVEKALDDLIAEEEDFKFQGLGVVLAKQKWPRLIASERRNDLGLDTHAKAEVEPDGRSIGLACSLTPECEKIAEDATNVKKNHPDVRVLVFATSVRSQA